jgi:hypothetical protein
MTKLQNNLWKLTRLAQCRWKFVKGFDDWVAGVKEFDDWGRFVLCFEKIKIMFFSDDEHRTSFFENNFWNMCSVDSAAIYRQHYPYFCKHVLLCIETTRPNTIRRPMWPSGVNTRLLRQRSRVRFPHSANICVHEHVCLYWVWVFLCIICLYLQKKM